MCTFVSFNHHRNSYLTPLFSDLSVHWFEFSYDSRADFDRCDITDSHVKSQFEEFLRRTNPLLSVKVAACGCQNGKNWRAQVTNENPGF
jgi:hypothetical protein